ncbi:hypothetical protein YC2023_058356 [Brassica napus]
MGFTYPFILLNCLMKKNSLSTSTKQSYLLSASLSLVTIIFYLSVTLYQTLGAHQKHKLSSINPSLAKTRHSVSILFQIPSH